MKTGHGDDMVVLVRLPQLIIVVQEDCAVCLRTVGEVLELVSSDFGIYFAPVTDGEEIHGHGLSLKERRRAYLIVCGVNERNKRVDGTVD